MEVVCKYLFCIRFAAWWKLGTLCLQDNSLVTIADMMKVDMMKVESET